MTELTIYRGTHQIGGCCTEITSGGSVFSSTWEPTSPAPMRQLPSRTVVNRQITKTSRILSVCHLFLDCEEVSLQEFTLNFGVSQRTALRDIHLLL